ncbi:MAG: YidC/Oxa1 family membrane protein insertase [bacterium]|nr:YidC/Oxa1 family membrane protein insertase [bacterium]
MPGWNLLTGGLGSVLNFFYSILPAGLGSARYGIAIIMLTLAVSLVLFPLTLKQTRSMKAMQEIQPEVEKLQNEFKEDRQELNSKLMELYQERGVNPAAGCLPLIVQMPIWFALFSVLRSSKESLADGSSPIPVGSKLSDALIAGQSDFLGMDLQITPSTASGDGFVQLIPYLVLILLVVASGYYQSVQTMKKRKDSPTEQNAQQQGVQNAMRFLPVLFGVFSWNFPTGLVLYFATSNTFRVGQQAYILSLDGGDDGPSTSSSDTPTDPKPISSGPSPNASKKKRNRRRKK